MVAVCVDETCVAHFRPVMSRFAFVVVILVLFVSQERTRTPGDEVAGLSAAPHEWGLKPGSPGAAPSPGIDARAAGGLVPGIGWWHGRHPPLSRPHLR
jgi:hypothetical protein